MQNFVLEGGAHSYFQEEYEKDSVCDPWFTFTHLITFWAFPDCLAMCGKKDPATQRAWREKMALLFIIVLCCGFLAFFTFGLQAVLCTKGAERIQFDKPPSDNSWAVGGKWYNLGFGSVHGNGTLPSPGDTRQRQISSLFPNVNKKASCDLISVRYQPSVCSAAGSSYCHKVARDDDEMSQYYLGIEVSYEWEHVQDQSLNLIVFNGIVLDASNYLAENKAYLGDGIDQLIRNNVGRDITKKVLYDNGQMMKMKCFAELNQVGFLEKESRGCFASSVINYITLVIILGLVFSRFIMAFIYSWFVAPSVGKPSNEVAPFYAAIKDRKINKRKTFYDIPNMAASSGQSQHAPANKRFSVLRPATSRFSIIGRSAPSIASENNRVSRYIEEPPSMADINAPHVVMLVTCYSESEKEIRNTLDSLAATEYSDRNKMFFIVADGLVVSSGDPDRLTPDICADLLELDSESLYNNTKHHCIAVAEGYKQNNMAQVLSGHYNYNGHRVPAILVVKCGTEVEQSERKPGNRGKRDSQVLLMNFLSKVMFDDRMTPLEYELFRKITKTSGVTPDYYEHVLMIDADTRVAPDSLQLLVNAMKNDVTIMGVCGETRIANKFASWVTTIQVYEYYVSHHLAKAFESMFGGVTCLPGCFALYRIKAPKDTTGDYWVPILANPNVVETYSQNVVDTLHKQNLFSLGEDRFLTTLMLKTFPKRKMMFLPQAVCKTEVPSKFSVLLSQRRRWINSTVHNLMELVMVKDLCGTFCFSMQMVVALELFGTVVLPAAIVFTGLLIYSIVMPARSFMEDSIIPLVMLISILILPGFLVLFTAHNPSYLLWMLVYLIALPIWNFVLPVYAFWNFDNFTWGKTRTIAGDKDDTTHGQKSGVFDTSNIVMKRYSEWERDKAKHVHGRDKPLPSITFEENYFNNKENIQQTDSPHQQIMSAHKPQIRAKPSRSQRPRQPAGPSSLSKIL